MLYVVISCLIFLECFLFWLIKRSPRLNFRGQEYPKIDGELIEKFRSFDPEIGWDIKPGSVIKCSRDGADYYINIDETGKRISNHGNDISSTPIYTFGDSYCMCREVADNHTWQTYLSKRVGREVNNFGVGNYGIDQAFLKLHKEREKNPKIRDVVFCITPYSITRSLSMWRHFTENGNVLAFKPIFFLDGDDLALKRNIIRHKSDLEYYDQKVGYLKKNDKTFDYFKKHVFWFPYSISMMRNFSVVKKELFYYTAKLFFFQKKFTKIALFFQKLYFAYDINYRSSLLKKHKRFYEKFISEVKCYCNHYNLNVEFFLVPPIEEVRYLEYGGNASYNELITILEQHFKVIDFIEELSVCLEPEKFFTASMWGGHLNETGNEKLSDFFLKNTTLITELHG